MKVRELFENDDDLDDMERSSDRRSKELGPPIEGDKWNREWAPRIYDLMDKHDLVEIHAPNRQEGVYDTLLVWEHGVTTFDLIQRGPRAIDTDGRIKKKVEAFASDLLHLFPKSHLYPIHRVDMSGQTTYRFTFAMFGKPPEKKKRR